MLGRALGILCLFSGLEPEPWDLVLNLQQLLDKCSGWVSLLGVGRPVSRSHLGLSYPHSVRQIDWYVEEISYFLEGNDLLVFLPTWLQFKDSVIVGTVSLRFWRLALL